MSGTSEENFRRYVCSSSRLRLRIDPSPGDSPPPAALSPGEVSRPSGLDIKVSDHLRVLETTVVQVYFVVN
jgi:hypothetical protein